MTLYLTAENIKPLIKSKCSVRQLLHHIKQLEDKNPWFKGSSTRPKVWTWEQVQGMKLHFKHNPILEGYGTYPRTRRDRSTELGRNGFRRGDKKGNRPWKVLTGKA